MQIRDHVDKGIINLESIILEKEKSRFCTVYLLCPLKFHTAESFKLEDPTHPCRLYLITGSFVTHGSFFPKQKEVVLLTHNPAHCAHGGLPCMDIEGSLNIMKGTWL